jgi:hypothetical protein
LNRTGPPPKGSRGKTLRYVGFALFIASSVLWAVILAVPFLPVATAWKVGIGTGIAITAEVAFWISAFILGREVVARYRRYLDPRGWQSDGSSGSEGAARTPEPPARYDDGT